MTRWCQLHGGPVLDCDAEIIGHTETGSGPGLPDYACRPCIRTEGIVPPRATHARMDTAAGRAK